MTDWLEEGARAAQRLWKDVVGALSPAEIERRVLDALRHAPQSSSALSQITEVNAASLYPVLLHLEMDGKVWSDWQSGPYPRQRMYQLVGPAVREQAYREQMTPPAAPDTAPHSMGIERDLTLHPYSPDEQRVVDWLINRTQGMIGAGNDPIGFLLASYDLVIAERNELQAKQDHQG